MALTTGLKGCILIIIVVSVLQTESRRGGGGGRSGGGGGRSSGGSRTSSGGSHSYGSSHSSYGSSHSSYGSSHSGYGSSHNYGTSHSTNRGGYGHSTGNSHKTNGPIGFESFGSGHTSHIKPQTYKPYQSQNVVYSSGRVEYHPPKQLQYTPPVSTFHYVYHPVPVYQPVHAYSSSSSIGNHGSSFLGGYLVGRLSSSGGSSHNHYYHHHHYTSSSDSNKNDDYYYRDDQTNLYTVHHYNQSPEKVPPKFSVEGNSVVECREDAAEKLCVPNTNSLCLRNGTIMCVTPTSFTSPCDNTTKTACVYSKIECAGKPPCNVKAYQTFLEFYLPCISNITLRNDKVYDNFYQAANYELCVTAIAEPKRLDSPVSALANFITVLGKHHIGNIFDQTNWTAANTTNVANTTVEANTTNVVSTTDVLNTINVSSTPNVTNLTDVTPTTNIMKLTHTT